MRRLSIAALLAMAVLGSNSAFGAEREWIVQAGGGVAGSSGLGIGAGRSASVGIAAPLRPWFLLGARVNLIRYAGADGGTAVPELNVEADPSDAIALAATFAVPVLLA